jgi:hypothetical protein
LLQHGDDNIQASEFLQGLVFQNVEANPQYPPRPF